MRNKKAKKKNSDINQHGLSRTIPPDVKQAVRKNAGFGCVICGLAITQYEHIDPEWHDAKVHDPDNMAALCGHHHDNVTRGYLSKETVKYWTANPKAKAKMYSEAHLDLLTKNLTIILGGGTFTNVTTPIGISGKPLFVVKPPINSSSEFLLSATFYNDAGNETLKIVDNRCNFSVDNWDVDFVGGRFEIRDQNKKVCLHIITEPPHKIIIDKLDMKVNGWTVIGDSETLTVLDPAGNLDVKIHGGRHNGANKPGGFNLHFGG